MENIYNKLPLYEACITDEQTGMYCISLVDDPAVEINWMAFANEKQPMSFAVQDEDKHLVLGVVMTANKPIFRLNAAGEGYYIRFSPETIRLMAEKYLKDGYHENVDTMHNDKLEKGVEMVQWFIKDTEKGINPIGFECEDGSLFAEFHITNEEIWGKIKDGTYQGFSLAGVFSIWEEEFNKVQKTNDLDDCIAILNKIIDKLNK